MVKNGFLHCHTMFSLFDSAVTPDELVKRAKELGAENITLTDHGTLLGIEPFMDAGAKYKINTIPGVELYLKHREHFILFAKNYKGYQAISKTMRNADYQPAKKSKKNKDSEEGSQRYYACVPDDKYPYGKPQTDEVARGSGNREYGCRRLREKLPNFSGVSFFRAGNSSNRVNAFHICVYVHRCAVPRYIALQHP